MGSTLEKYTSKALAGFFLIMNQKCMLLTVQIGNSSDTFPGPLQDLFKLQLLKGWNTCAIDFMRALSEYSFYNISMSTDLSGPKCIMREHNLLHHYRKNNIDI